MSLEVHEFGSKPSKKDKGPRALIRFMEGLSAIHIEPFALLDGHHTLPYYKIIIIIRSSLFCLFL